MAAELNIARDTIDTFERVTRFDLTAYLNNWTVYVNNHYQGFVDFFEGVIDTIPKDSIEAFDSIKKQSDQLEDIMGNARRNFDRNDFMYLIEFIDEIRGKIFVNDNISRFIRSTKYDVYSESKVSQEYQVRDSDTPESIAAQDRTNPKDAWVDIYTKNHVRETDYQAEKGGYNLRLAKQSLGNLFLRSVVDNLVGDNLYGKDLDRKFVYENDDLRVLPPRDTAVQSVQIMGRVAKGDIPEYSDLGLSKDLQVGSTLGLVSVPFITRELKEMFSTDDTMLDFSVTEIDIEGTAIKISYEVRTFFDFVINNNLTIR